MARMVLSLSTNSVKSLRVTKLWQSSGSAEGRTVR